MAEESFHIAVCVCTYRRPALLKCLLADLAVQTVQPESLIIVDGDPRSGAVQDVLRVVPDRWRVTYIPSNYANLPYQRYLGWRQASGSKLLLYFDDDIRIPAQDSVEKVIAPLTWSQRNVVGVTVTFHPPEVTADAAAPSVLLSASRGTEASGLMSWLQRRRGVVPGGVTPTGNRVMPVRNTTYAPVQCMCGGVMAYRMSALSEDCFFEDLFALFQVGCTLGEDTILSTRVAKHGELLLAFCATFRHPREEPSLCQAGEPSRRGYAVAYSRRFINDHYRGFDLPTAGDRLALVKSYAGNILLNWLRAMTSFRLHRFAYASGYTLGALRGLLQKPTAASLTPNIDWWAEAERALAGRILIREGIVS